MIDTLFKLKGGKMSNIQKQHSTSVKSCQVQNGAIQENMEQLDIYSCQNTGCKHHIFYYRVFENNTHHGKHPTYFTPNETEVSRSFGNCMVRLNRELTLEEIAEIYGVSRQSITRVIDSVLNYIGKQNGGLKEYVE
jgi:hypothetical protein